ncbi:unnamed protein product [Closterium sp. Naga37s-1]|nr:unnamed protein product [Closterium sp. Naga37s-1]
MGVKLQIQLLEARGLPPKDNGGARDAFVRFQMGGSKARSRSVAKENDPTWQEEFIFSVSDMEKDELLVTVWDKSVFLGEDFLGQLVLPVRQVLACDSYELQATWFPLQNRPVRPRATVTGDVLISASLWGVLSLVAESVSPSSLPSSPLLPPTPSHSAPAAPSTSPLAAPSPLQQLKQRLHASKLSARSAIRSFGHAVENSVAKAGQTVRGANAKGGGGAPVAADGEEGEGESRRGSLGEGDGAGGGGSGEPRGGGGGTGEAGEVEVPGVWWEQDMRDVPSAGPMPGELAGGGVLVDQAFDAAPHALFAAIFKPDSPFFQEFATVDSKVQFPQPPPSSLTERKLTQVNIGPWFFTDSSTDSSHIEAKLNRSTAHKGIKPPANLPPAAAPRGSVGAEQPQEDTGAVMHRTVSYMTAPSSLVKSVQATEEVLCVRADAGGFLVAVTAKTPDVPYGGTFEIHLQLCITPLTEESMGAGGGAGGGNTGEQSSKVPASAAAGDGRETGAEGSGSGVKSRLRVSYEPYFLQSTMMKGMIENGIRTGLKESYTTFLSVLTKHVPPFVSTAPSTSLSQPSTSPPPSSPLARLLSLLGVPPHLHTSETAIAEAALRAAGPLALFVFFLAVVLLPMHLVLVARGGAGVVLPLLDLPDSLLELLWCAVILLSTNHVVAMARGIIVSEYIKKGDHGKKAVGEGWLLTVSLVEGENIGDSGVVMKADPFVVFTCSGKTRTSSVKLQTNMPNWNEVLEFDAMEDAPSILEIEVFNYDGPFSEPSLLGRAEINFLRQSAQDLADLWVPLEGRRVKVQAARIRVRVLLTNTSEDVAPLVLQKISKEVGSKGGVREFSVQKNAAFQRLFDLPESECLINDFSCILKKGLLSQGRLFLSQRLLAFYSSVFGTRIQFTLLWEDIDEIDDSVPSLFDPASLSSQKDTKSQPTPPSLTRSQTTKSQTGSAAQKPPAAAAQKSSMTTFKRMLNPAITVFVKKDKGTAETRAAAYGVDSQGRLKIRFQSFVRPGVAFRLVLALWRNRNLPTDQQLARAKEEGDASDSGGERGEGTTVGRDGGAGAAGVSSSGGHVWAARGGAGGGQEVTDSRREWIAVEDGGGAFMGVETREVIDDQLVGVPITVRQFLTSFEDPAATAAMMEKAGQMGAEISDWEAVSVGMGDGVGQLEGRAAGGRVGGVLRRQRSVKYRFSRQVPVLSPTVTAVQQMTQQVSTPGGTPGGSQEGGIQWACLEQVLTLHRVPFGDSFQLEISQEIQAKETFSLPGTAAGTAAGTAGGESSPADTPCSSSTSAEAAATAARGAAAVASALVAAAGALKLTARGGAAASGTAAGDIGGASGERGTAGSTAGAGAAGGVAGSAGRLQEGVLQDEKVRSVLHVRVAIAWHKELSEATRTKIKSSIGRFYKQQARRVVELMAAHGT